MYRTFEKYCYNPVFQAFWKPKASGWCFGFEVEIALSRIPNSVCVCVCLCVYVCVCVCVSMCVCVYVCQKSPNICEKSPNNCQKRPTSGTNSDIRLALP